MKIKRIIDSTLAGPYERHGIRIEISIYRLADTDWSLEITWADGTSTVWEESFSDDQAAYDEAVRAISSDWIESFSHTAATAPAT